MALLRDRYRVRARIGQGGAGAVFRALDTTSGHLVAIKQLACASTAEIDSISREADLLGRLSHRGLPTVLDCFVESNTAFVVMTFVPGQDLAHRLTRRAAPFPARTVLAWADDLLEVLSYLHSRQVPVIHRDIKPRNIKVDANGRAVLLDFGTATNLDSPTHGVPGGYTLRYAPLEQIRSEAADIRSDLFALGATLYELLSRRTPLDAVARSAAIATRGTDPLVPLHTLAPWLPTSVADVITLSLGLSPAERPATARAMRVALQEAAEGDVTAAPTTPAVVFTPPPTGTVTFLAVQIDPSASSASDRELAQFDTAIRRVVDAHGGYLVRTDATGCISAFSTAEAAVRAAVATRAAVTSFRPGSALMTAAAQLRDAEYVSSALPRLGRLVEAAHRGQIVLGQSTATLLRAALSNDLTLADLGLHRLRDISEPEHVYQLQSALTPETFPPLNAGEVRAPVQGWRAVPPIGRDAELSELVRLLRAPATRLLTIVGPGGVGKTCLAAYVAETTLDDFAEGVHVVPLGHIRDADLVPSAVGHAVGALEQSQATLTEAIAAQIGARDMLLVLDNFEHLLSAAQLVERLLDACPRLKVLTTSRAALGVSDEVVWPLEPLACANPDRLPVRLDELLAIPSIALFVKRAREVEPRFALDASSAPAIASICARLDGLPLALELAAARVDLFAPDALLLQLERGLVPLTARASDLEPRQQTLRATLAWSVQLLSSSERSVFIALGAFVGGWDLQAAEAVCRPQSGDDAGLLVVDGLARLAAVNLIRIREGRYEMLETTREFAVKLLKRTDQHDVIRQQHAAYFERIGASGDAEMGGPRMGAWLIRLESEHANLRAALAWFESTHAIDAALGLAAALWRFWQVHAHVTEGRRWLERLLGHPPGASEVTPARARALVGAGALAWRAQDGPAARRWLVEARWACEAAAELAGLATALKFLGVIALKGPPPDLVGAADLFERSLRVRRELGDRDGIASCLNDLGVLALDRGDYPRARTLLDESLQLCRALDNRYGTSFVLNNLSMLALNEGTYDSVPALLRESLDLARELGSREKVACALTGLASLAAVTAAPFSAARLFGAAEALRARIGVPMSPAEQSAHDRHLDRARADVLPSEWEAAMVEGREADVDTLLETAVAELLVPARAQV
jgi:predicted ATPase